MFSGQGAQYAQMTQGLYATESVFQEALDECALLLLPKLGQDIRTLIFSDDAEALRQTAITQPVLFAVEYALAQLWINWGIQPKALVGHSLGEYVAACLAGVFSLSDALTLVAERGKLLQALPTGAMIAVQLAEAAVQKYLSADVSLAVINGADRCTLSGTHEAMARVEQQLQAAGIEWRRLRTSHAFHSAMMEPALQPFLRQLQRVTRHAPTIPFLSNVTGTWISPQQATDPDYWVAHIRQTVRFADNLQTLFEQDASILLEVGPGRTLATLAQRHPNRLADCAALHTLPRDRSTTTGAEVTHILTTLGRLWAHGAVVDWGRFYAAEQRRRVPLPTYPFERQRYWIEADPHTPAPLVDHKEIAALFAVPQPVRPTRVQETQPLSPIEQQIAELWTVALGVTDIDPTVDFFDAGGDSLLAVQLMTRLREQFGVNLDTHALLQASTIAELAALIGENESADEAPRLPDVIVPFQAGSPRRSPLFLLHPVGGHVYFYRQLVAHLETDRPIYGIRAVGTEGESDLLTTIPDMADYYTAALQTVQPHGPYHLLGSSFGGTLAYAMAQKLLGQGEQIAFLGMIDTPSVGNMPTAEFVDSAEILTYLLHVGSDATLDSLQHLDEDGLIDFYAQQMGSTEDGVRAMLNLFKTMCKQCAVIGRSPMLASFTTFSHASETTLLPKHLSTAGYRLWKKALKLSPYRAITSP